MPSITEIESLSIKCIYRLFIQNMKYYPSKNRFSLLVAIKEEYLSYMN